jgi:uncharacterized protein (TIGR02647 family)
MPPEPTPSYQPNREIFMFNRSAIEPGLAAELELLARFDLHSLQSGLKVHHDAPATVIAAAARLHAKGLITEADGGFLTDLGVEITEHLQHVLSALKGH